MVDATDSQTKRQTVEFRQQHLQNGRTIGFDQTMCGRDEVTQQAATLLKTVHLIPTHTEHILHNKKRHEQNGMEKNGTDGPCRLCVRTNKCLNRMHTHEHTTTMHQKSMLIHLPRDGELRPSTAARSAVESAFCAARASHRPDCEWPDDQ